MISVIIPAYNAGATIAACLASLRVQDPQPAGEVVVVDSSSDDTPGIVARGFPEVDLIHLPGRTDPGTARNLGIARTRGEILAFTDADCQVAPDWIEALSHAHGGPYRIIGGSVMSANPPGDAVGLAGYLAEFREFLPERPRAEVPHIPTCNISYRREVFDRFGGYDGRFYPQEDLVFHRRLRRAGERILFDPAIRVRHRHRSRPADFLEHQRRIGEVTCRTLAALDGKGTAFTRLSWLLPALLPLLGTVKFGRTLAVFLRLRPEILLRQPLSVPLFALGLLWWALGFGRAVIGGPGPRGLP